MIARQIGFFPECLIYFLAFTVMGSSFALIAILCESFPSDTFRQLLFCFLCMVLMSSHAVVVIIFAVASYYIISRQRKYRIRKQEIIEDQFWRCELDPCKCNPETNSK